MLDTPLAIACAVIAILSFVLQIGFACFGNQLPIPSREILVFSKQDRIFQSINILQLCLTVIVLALVASLVPIHKEHSALPAAIGYSLFPAILSIVTLVSFVLAYASAVFRGPWHILTLCILNVLFTLCAAIALSARLGAPFCLAKDELTENPILNAYPPAIRQSACQRVQAAAVFYFFLLGAHIATLVMAVFPIEGDDVEQNATRSSRRSVSPPNSRQLERTTRRNSYSSGTRSIRSGELAQRTYSEGGVTQYYRDAAVMNIISGDGPPITQHYQNSRVVNITADSSTINALARENRIPSNLLT